LEIAPAKTNNKKKLLNFFIKNNKIKIAENQKNQNENKLKVNPKEIPELQTKLSIKGFLLVTVRYFKA
jgi:tmRNA-binding protein